MSNPHSDTTTDGIRVYAAAEFMPQDVLPQEFRPHGDEEQQSYVFRYKITMTNVGESRARAIIALRDARRPWGTAGVAIFAECSLPAHELR